MIVYQACKCINMCTRDGGKISGLFIRLSLQVQLPTHIRERKLHFIAYKSVSLFLNEKFVYTKF